MRAEPNDLGPAGPGPAAAPGPPASARAPARSPLADVRPGASRWAGAVVAAVAVVGLGVLGGVAPERSVLLGAAAVVAVLAVRVAGDDPVWPPPPARRTRPGWHVVATTLRQLEGAARTDASDRASLRARLARLERDGTHPAGTAVRGALPGTVAPPRSAPPPTPLSRSTS